MGKTAIYIEYPLKSASLPVLWNSVGTPYGLAEWFADGVTVEDNQYTFVWEKHEQLAVLQDIKPLSYIRFQWEEDQDTDAYFEIKILTGEITGDLILAITDFAEPDEIEDMKLLWNHQIDALRRKTGL